MDVAVGGAAENAVEPAEESGQRTVVRLPLGLRSSADSAGLSERALKAEKMTEMAMVSANCW